jgi:phosphatidylglycerol:prolipoprotein diacylglycerol transferase
MADLLTPDPILVQLGPIPVYWYGICYALGLIAVYVVVTREATRKGLDAGLVVDAMIVIAIAALIGGRLYHVIDRWDLYADDWLAIVLPPYTGLGVFGGLLLGTLVGIGWIKHKRQSVAAWADVVAPALFAMQAIGRWGNFFNQELYGPPTDLPWGIPIDCAYRIASYPCAAYPFETTRFHPLFLYESLAAIAGLVALLWLARHAASRLRPGDLLGIFFVWYGAVRFALEALRTENWVVGGVPTAWYFSAGAVGLGLVILGWNRLRGGPSVAAEDARRLAERAAGDATGTVADPAAETAPGPASASEPAPGPDEAEEQEERA